MRTNVRWVGGDGAGGTFLRRKRHLYLPNRGGALFGLNA